MMPHPFHLMQSQRKVADTWSSDDPASDNKNLGFRVASNIPEPATLSLLALGGLAILRRRSR